MSFRFAVMMCRFFVMVRGIVMMPCSRMFTGHDYPPRHSDIANQFGRQDGWDFMAHPSLEKRSFIRKPTR